MLAGQASQTARRVAAQRLTFTRVPYDDSLASPVADERLQSAVAAGVEAAGDSPLTGYLRARTYFVDRCVVSALNDGVRQLVAVGAGYDGRAWRYRTSGTQWFELDHPATQADKLALVEALGLGGDDGVRFAAADFSSDDVGAVLAAAGHDATRPSLFVCEGVAEYLPADVLHRLLTALADRAAVGSRLALSLSLTTSSAEASERRQALATAVQAMGEPLQSPIERASLATLLRAAGWELRSAVDPRGEPAETSEIPSAFVVATPATSAGR